MNVTGIIAEYNPFHNGHLYQLEKARNDTNADYLIVVMSGDFVQRGAPALIDKYTRAKMALENGADLVLELPVLWSTASAEYFAGAGKIPAALPWRRDITKLFLGRGSEGFVCLRMKYRRQKGRTKNKRMSLFLNFAKKTAKNHPKYWVVFR